MKRGRLKRRISPKRHFEGNNGESFRVVTASGQSDINSTVGLCSNLDSLPLVLTGESKENQFKQSPLLSNSLVNRAESPIDEPVRRTSDIITISTRNKVHCETLVTLGIDGFNENCEKNCLESEFVSSSKLNEKDNRPVTEKDEFQLECEVCQICHKDISAYNSQRRLQHTNRCIDELETHDKEKKRKDEAFNTEKIKVLDCPACGKKFKTQTSRHLHLKQCSVKLNISPVTMMQIIKKQEDDHQHQLQRFSYSEECEDFTVKTKMNPVRKIQRSAKNRLEEPLSKLDEDTHLAIALSTSVEEERTEHLLTENESLDKISRLLPSSRDAFSLLMSQKKPDNLFPGKRGKKNNNKQTIPLLALDQNELKRRLAEKAAALVFEKEDYQTQYDQLFYSSLIPSVNSRISQKYPNKRIQDSDSSQTFLWCIAGQNNLNVNAYYVNELMPPVVQKTNSCSSQNHLHFNSIQRNIDKKHQVDKGTVFVGSTQTALVLAELATEAGDVTLMNYSDESPKKCHITDASVTKGFCLATVEVNEKATLDLIGALDVMVDNSQMSDVTLELMDGQTIHLHRFILSIRCSNLLKIIDSDPPAINFKQFSKVAALSVVRFIYCADVDVPHSVVFETRVLAQRLGLTFLAQICDDIIETYELLQPNEKSTTVDAAATGDSGDEMEESLRKESENIEENELDLDEVYVFMLTQKQKALNGKPRCDDDDDDDDDVDDDNEEAESRRNTSISTCFQKSGSHVLTEYQSDDDDEKNMAPIQSKADDPESLSLSQALISRLETSFILNETFPPNKRQKVSPIKTESCDLTDDGDLCSRSNLNEWASNCENEVELTDINLSSNFTKLHQVSSTSSCLIDSDEGFVKEMPENSSQLNLCVVDTTLRYSMDDDFNNDLFEMDPESDATSNNICYTSIVPYRSVSYDDEVEAMNENESNEEILKRNSISGDCSDLSDDLFPSSPENTSLLMETSTNEEQRSEKQGTSLLQLEKQGTSVKLGKQETSCVRFKKIGSRSKSQDCVKDNQAFKSNVDSDFKKCRESEVNFGISIRREEMEVVQLNDHQPQNFHQSLPSRIFSTKDDYFLDLSESDTLPDLIVNEDDNGTRSTIHKTCRTSEKNPSIVCEKNSSRADKTSKSPTTSSEENNCEITNIEIKKTSLRPVHGQLHSEGSIKSQGSLPFQDHLNSQGHISSQGQIHFRGCFLSQGRLNSRSSDVQTSNEEKKINIANEKDLSATFHIHSRNNSCVVVIDDDDDEDNSNDDKSIAKECQERSDIFSSPVVQQMNDNNIREDFQPEEFSRADVVENEYNLSEFEAPTTPRVPCLIKTSTIGSQRMSYSPPTDMETDISNLMDDIANSSLLRSDVSFNGNNDLNVSALSTAGQTPSTCRGSSKVNPTTPFPEYGQMQTPVLHQYCNRFGIRRLPKKQMIKVLENVFYETHPETKRKEPEVKVRKKSKKKTTDDEKMENKRKKSKTASTSDAAVKVKANSKQSNANSAANRVNQRYETFGKQGTSITNDLNEKGLTFQQCHVLSSSDESGDAYDLNSSNETPHEYANVGFYEYANEDSEGGGLDSASEESTILVKRRKGPQTKMDDKQKKEILLNFFSKNGDLYQRILNYEPLELDYLQKTLKENDIKVATNLLIDFLDEQNILFSTRNSRIGWNRRKAPEKVKTANRKRKLVSSISQNI